MSHWTSLNADDLKAAGLGNVVDKAASTAVGATDPVAEEIANAVARVRRAVSGGGNQLDADAARVPRSLKAVTVRIAFYALCARLRWPLSDDQKSLRDDDTKDLSAIGNPAKKTFVETPDTPAGMGEMQTPSTFFTVQDGNSGNAREDLRGL